MAPLLGMCSARHANLEHAESPISVQDRALATNGSEGVRLEASLQLAMPDPLSYTSRWRETDSALGVTHTAVYAKVELEVVPSTSPDGCT